MKANYGNWISRTMMKTFCGVAVGFYVLTGVLYLLLGKDTYYYVAWILAVMATLAMLYMGFCRYVFSFEGGGLMRRIHMHLLEHLPWDGKGTLLDVGCGSGALSIAAAKKFPTAKVRGIDYWSAMWNYSQEQCARNAEIEGVGARCTFTPGDAAKLDFPSKSFDAVVSNFVYHEVRTQKDKFMLVEETLRTLKKGGCFALQDTFGDKDRYGRMEEFLDYLKEHDEITEIAYVPNIARRISMPFPVRLMLRDCGLIYGKK
ncbi:class I SAM-dependent methyltransferase [Selenomonas sp. F0473]|uniref:class I SAM-dependent methyltransferase n=1 Tax=Selenomonas sp. F0473 TaxID=999423 RepID=UPI00029E3F23|nr:class I SAM-dependent methyltransferase [Selenomonas sp. F0473]EKU71323.1 hypothetical protein HMPREF9161_01029 [Selenomonas sp. F0473]